METWCLGLPRFHRIEQIQTSSRLASSARRIAGLRPFPIAESKDLERSPEIWIDDQSGAVHAAWVGNERRKPGGPRSELRISHRRSEDGGTTWTPPRHFSVGTALARRPQLRGDARGDLYLANSNGYPDGQERIHLFQSDDGGGSWQPVAVNFSDDKKRGNTGSPQLAVGTDGGAYLVWLDSTVGRKAVVFSRTTGKFAWSAPVRLNDDPALNCAEPRLAVQGDTIYVAWRVVKGDRTTLYFDHSQDGGATWNTDQVIFERKALSVQASLQPLDGGLMLGWFESQMQMGQNHRRLAYRLYSPAKGWGSPEGERDSMAGDHGPGRFYHGFDLLRWRRGCLVAYSKGAIGVSPEIYLAWSPNLESGFSELLKISEPKKGFEHLYPRLVRSGEKRGRRSLQPAQDPPVTYGAESHPGGFAGRSDRNPVVGGQVWKTIFYVGKPSCGHGLSPVGCRVRGVMLLLPSDSARIVPRPHVLPISKYTASSPNWEEYPC